MVHNKWKWSLIQKEIKIPIRKASAFSIITATMPINWSAMMRYVLPQLFFFSLLILQEYHDNIGDLEGPEEKDRAQAKVQKFITAFET